MHEEVEAAGATAEVRAKQEVVDVAGVAVVDIALTYSCGCN